MSRFTLHTPPGRDRAARELVYTEPAARDRGLYVLLQDTLPRTSQAREQFLRVAFRSIVAHAFASDRPRAAAGVLRDIVRELDRLAGAVDTRLDDFRGLGIHVLLREGDRHYLLVTRGSTVRVRDNGIFVPLVPGTPDVEEVSIETARTQHDLFTPTLPESLMVLCIWRPAAASQPLELLLGGDGEDLVATIDSLDLTRESRGVVEVERLRNAVLHVVLDPFVPRAAAGTIVVREPRTSPPLRRATWAAASALVVAALIGLAVVRPWEHREASRDTARARVTQERVTPIETRAVPPPVQEIAQPESATEKVEEKEGFRVAWENEYRAAVTSSPAALGDAIVFGARDGRVYALERAGGAKVWSHAAAGGVGASPVVSGNAVIAADYTGVVVRLSGDKGSPVWKRALREKIVSTPAIGSDRVAVGTSRGNVYALSLETGRVLWKFGTRAQIRGNILHARDTFYVPSHDGKLYALADDTGARRWAVSLGGPVGSSPAFDGDHVVVGSAGGDVIALDPANGKRAWAVETRGSVNGALAAEDGRIYAASSDRSLYCINAADGAVVWKAATGGTVLSRPVVFDRLVLVTAYDGLVYCFDAGSGEVIDRFDTAQPIFSSPLVVGDRVFFGNNDGRFYCLRTPRS